MTGCSSFGQGEIWLAFGDRLVRSLLVIAGIWQLSISCYRRHAWITWALICSATWIVHLQWAGFP